jgi:Asp-tRNA(Asn)/Glu-tRNA(Gln) amidotransferase A subunit family amidase
MAGGLPAGVQLVSGRFLEDRALAAGEVIESAAAFSALAHLLAK